MERNKREFTIEEFRKVFTDLFYNQPAKRKVVAYCADGNSDDILNYAIQNGKEAAYEKFQSAAGRMLLDAFYNELDNLSKEYGTE